MAEAAGKKEGQKGKESLVFARLHKERRGTGSSIRLSGIRYADLKSILTGWLDAMFRCW